MAKMEMDRRDLVKGLLAVCGLSGCSEALPVENLTLPGGPLRDKLTETERTMLTRLSALILPDTDTPGALAAGVPEKLEAFWTQWATTAMRAEWLQGLANVETALDQIAGQKFLDLEEGAQEEALNALDAAAFSGQAAPEAYLEIKSLIATTYYLSEVGATQELRYELIPGDWKACIPFEDIGRTWAV